MEVELITVGLTKLVLSGAVLRLPDAGAAKLKTPRDTANVISRNAAKIRGLKMPELEEKILFMREFIFELAKEVRKERGDIRLLFHDNWFFWALSFFGLEPNSKSPGSLDACCLFFYRNYLRSNPTIDCPLSAVCYGVTRAKLQQIRIYEQSGWP